MLLLLLDIPPIPNPPDYPNPPEYFKDKGAARAAALALVVELAAIIVSADPLASFYLINPISLLLSLLILLLF